MVRVIAPLKLDGDPGVWAGIRARQTIFRRLEPRAAFKLAYDDANLYAQVTVQDDTPLKNGASILPELLKGGDAVDLCFGAPDDPALDQRILIARVGGQDQVVAMRPHWKVKRPYTYFTPAGGTVTMDFAGSVLGEGAAAFSEATPGGYIMEAKIPWASLGMAPGPGLTFPFDAQIIFSDPSGTTNVDTAWWHSSGGNAFATTDLATEARLYPESWGTAQLFENDPGYQPEQPSPLADPVFTPRGLPISFTLPRDCRVSAIVREADGWVVRELLRAQSMKAGPHTIYWDGRDRWGALEPAGAYSYRIGYFDGFKTSFVGSAGNSANPPYRTADGLGSIGGMHAGPQAVAAATDGPYMYLLNGGEEGQQSLRKMEIATGKSLWFHSVGGFGTGEAVAADQQFAYMIYAANNVTNFVRMDPASGKDLAIGKRGTTINLGNITVAGMAIVGAKAYYTVPAQNRIGVIDLETGETGADIPVPAPAGTCAAPGGNALLVCTGTQVVRLDVTTGTQTPVVAGLEAATAVAADGAGDLYVSDLGKTQQIKKFSAAGQLLATFGVAGGRGLSAVPYNPLAFRNVRGLAVGPDNNLWTVEPYQAPRRYGRFTLDGQWVQDIYGPARCGVAVGFDLDDVSKVYYHGQPDSDGQFIESTVDYAAYAKAADGAKGFKVDAIWRMNQSTSNQDVTPDLMLPEPGPATSSYSRAAVFTGTNGHRYFWLAGGSRCGLWIWVNGKWQAAASVGGSKTDTVWADTNGDGLVEPGETSDVPNQGSWGGSGRDLTLYGTDGKLQPATVDTRGVPDYRGGQFTPYLSGTYPTLGNYFDNQAYSDEMVEGTSDDSVYFSENNGPHQNRDFWDRCSENRIVKIQNGKVQWIVGHHDGSTTHDGDQIISFGVAGESDGVVITSDVGAEFVGYTTDGLALGWALKDETGMPPSVGPTSIYVENAAPGVFIKDPATGRHLLLTHSSEDARILEVTGVFGKDITRIDGPLNLANTEWRAAEATSRATRIPYVTWHNSIYEVWRSTNVDAYDYEWTPAATALPIYQGKIMVGEVRLRRDAGNLCVFADVLDEAPFGASGGTAPAFGHSDGVELLLGATGSVTANRTAAAPGDTRLFLSAARGTDGQLTGKVWACKPASDPVPPSPWLSQLSSEGKPRDKGTTKPLDLTTGMTQVPGALIAVRERFDRHGYALEAEIPLALVPELARPTSVAFWHAGNHDLGVASKETRYDLLPVRLNAALWIGQSAGTPHRIPWLSDGFAGTDPTAMNPGAWGIAADPLLVNLSVSANAPASPGIAYETTSSSVYGYGGGPTVKITSAIFGGGWFHEGGAQFETTAARDGFSLVAGPGSELPFGTSRSAKVDMSAVGINSSESSGLCESGDGKPVTATVKVNFPPGQKGELHILWGTFTDNSAGGGDLSVYDSGTAEVWDKTKAPGLSFQIPYNSGCATRESDFLIDGQRSLTIDLADNVAAQKAVLHAIWITPVDNTRFAPGTPLSVAAYTGSLTSTVHSVQFFADGVKIGEATQAPYAIAWKPSKAKTYQLTAQVSDVLGATGSSEAVPVTITP